MYFSLVFGDNPYMTLRPFFHRAIKMAYWNCEELFVPNSCWIAQFSGKTRNYVVVFLYDDLALS